jgi:uncharacterized protein (TIGR02466 family)
VNLIPLFPTAVAKFELGRDFTAEELAFVNSQPTYKNMGNTTSDDTYVLAQGAMADLKEFIETSVAKYLHAIHEPQEGVSLRLTQSWINYTKPGEYHHKHEHPNSLVSGVLYINANCESDKIYFYKNLYQQIVLPIKNYNSFNSISWWIPVNTGELILFPSSLTHMVETVKGNDTRISLSFNTFPIGNIGEDKSLTALHV